MLCVYEATGRVDISVLGSSFRVSEFRMERLDEHTVPLLDDLPIILTKRLMRASARIDVLFKHWRWEILGMILR